LDRLKDKLAVGDAVIEKAAYVYRKALEKGLVRGRSISALVAAALYAACRDTETPRTLKDIAHASNIKKKDVARCYRLLIRELDLKMPVR
jgi:transcription initiation factor TFIIB